MPGILALDVGTRRTGVALFDPRVGFALPLDTVHHQTMEELFEKVLEIGQKREVSEVVVGLPLLPSGAEGSQAKLVRSFGDLLTKSQWKVTFRDERYTTSKRTSFDGDAAAAISLLEPKK